jgi:hypothetical protein
LPRLPLAALGEEGGDGQLLEYRSEASAIDFTLQGIPFEHQVDTKAQASDDLSKKGRWKNFCGCEECYGSCYKCEGRYGRPEIFEDRKFYFESDGTKEGTMEKWMKFVGKLQEWQQDYLTVVDDLSVERRMTLETVNNIHRIFFGLYLGSQGNCTLTHVYRRHISCNFETTSDEDYFLLSGPKGEKFVLEKKTTTLHETYRY